MIRVHALYDKQTGRGSLSAECSVSPRRTASLDVAPFDPGTRRNDFPFDFDSSLSRRALTSRVNRPTERHSFTAATVLLHAVTSTMQSTDQEASSIAPHYTSLYLVKY